MLKGRSVISFLSFFTAISVASCSIDSFSSDTESDEILSSKIVNTSHSSVSGSLIVEFNNSIYTPEVTTVLPEGVVIEPLFTTTSDDAVEMGLDKWALLHFDSEADKENIALTLSELDVVKHIQYNKLLSKEPVSEGGMFDGMVMTKSSHTDFTYNDPMLADQWNFINPGNTSISKDAIEGADISIRDAWQLTSGDPDIIVAVLDGAVMYTHPDLAANMWVNEKELNGEPGVDDDGNGYIDDIHGYNFVANGELCWSHKEDSGHGTHVAGTIAAVNNNGIGVSGIAGGSGNGDGVRIMSCQIFDNDQGTSASLARAFMYAADNGAVIAQCSFGYNASIFSDFNAYIGECAAEYSGLTYFLNKKKDNDSPIDGNIAIFSAGNDGDNKSSYPGALKEVISVTAIGPGFRPAGYTNYGPGCNIAAPGGDYYVGRTGSNKLCQILSTTIDSKTKQADYSWMEGTSMACPHVSGVAALGLSYARKLGKKFTRDQFISMMLTSVNEIDSYLEGTKPMSATSTMYLNEYKGKMGTGSIDAWKLLMQIEGTPSLQIGLGETTLELNKIMGDEAKVMKAYSISIDDSTMSALGINETPSVSAAKVNINCTKIGSGKIVISAISEGITVEREFSLISRVSVSDNGGWL